MTIRSLRTVVLSVALLASAPLASASAATNGGPLTAGFSSDSALTYQWASASSRQVWLNRANSENAHMVRYDLAWSDFATNSVSGNPADPGNPDYSYRFSVLDAVVRQVTAHHLKILMNIFLAPRWAENANDLPDQACHSNPPARALKDGTWCPNAQAYGQFATAVARRYSGTYPDPLHRGQFLPRIQYWQAWNEENLYSYLSPQWGKSGPNTYVPLSPDIYRQLLDSFYHAVKSVSSSNVVVMGGTAPYGDVPHSNGQGTARMRPLTFDRYLFCLASSPGCPGRSDFDVLDHHPYEFNGAPDQPARLKDDVTVPDIWRLTQLVRSGVSRGTIQPATHKGMWITEIGWDSRPNAPSSDTAAVSLQTQARYVPWAEYVLWRQGVQTILWEEIRDAAPNSPYTFQNTGMYFYNGNAKPASANYRFPFYVRRLSSSSVLAWQLPPISGSLAISKKTSSGAWKPLARFNVIAGHVFTTALHIRGGAVLRARVGKLISVPYSVGS